VPARVVRGELNSSESLSRVSLGAELLFVKLLLIADDYGRADGRLRTIRTSCFPMRDQVGEEQIEQWLDELAVADPQGTSPVLRYEVEGRPYLALTGWEKHRGGGRRGSKSRYPDHPSLPRKQEIVPRNSNTYPSGDECGRRETNAGDERRAAAAAEERPSADAPWKKLANLLKGAEADERDAWLESVGQEVHAAGQAETPRAQGESEKDHRARVNAARVRIVSARWRTYLHGPREFRGIAERQRTCAEVETTIARIRERSPPELAEPRIPLRVESV